MAVQAYPYLVMTDGVDTVTFADGLGGVTNWPPVRGQWAPAIAGVRMSPLAGRGPYADVSEDLACNVRNTTAALTYGNLDTLVRLLDKAERWWLRNEPIPPVLLKYAPQGSTIHDHVTTPMQAIVLGRAGASELNGVSLPENVNDAGMLFEIYGVRVMCLRRGAWTGKNDTTGASATAANPTVMTRAFVATHPVNSPVDITIAGFNGTTTPTIQAGYLVVGSVSTDIQIVEAEAGASGVFTSVADAANNARGGSVLRFTPAGITPVTSGPLTLSLIGGQCAIIAAVRNNSATTTFLLQANCSGFGYVTQTPPVLIDTSTTQPRLVLLGITGSNAANAVTLTATASAASGTLDIDYIIVVNLRDETVSILAHDAVSLAGVGAGAASLAFDFNPLLDQNPRVFVSGSSGNVPLVYRGPVPLLTTGINLYALWTATNGASWRFTTTAPAVLSVSLNATRYRSYVSPQ